MLVAPTELRHAAFRELTRSGKGSNLPETWGCDFGFIIREEDGAKKYGIQRKELKDFVASVNDGRLAKEVQQMVVCEQTLLVIEGTPRFSMDGALLGNNYGSSWSRQQHTSMLLSVQAADVWVLGTSDTRETAQLCLDFQAWIRKGEHTSLRKRGGPVHPWGRKENRDYCLHLIMGLPQIGIELADRILDTIGMPFGLAVTREQLMSVDGIGAKTADSIIRALGNVS